MFHYLYVLYVNLYGFTQESWRNGNAYRPGSKLYEIAHEDELS